MVHFKTLLKVRTQAYAFANTLVPVVTKHISSLTHEYQLLYLRADMIFNSQGSPFKKVIKRTNQYKSVLFNSE